VCQEPYRAALAAASSANTLDNTIHQSFLPHNDPNTAPASFRVAPGFEVRQAYAAGAAEGPLHARRRTMTSRLANLHLDAVDPTRVADFWCEVLGWQVLATDEDVGLVEIGPADGRWPGIDIMRVPEPKTGKNRLHLDLRADGSTTAEERPRLLALGATRTEVGQPDDVSWVVLADPEGNEFCLLARPVQELPDHHRDPADRS
jgi:predicted enzyme related to lactoylglutathione lyase